jgi:hypothetical protein
MTNFSWKIFNKIVKKSKGEALEYSQQYRKGN